MSEASLFDLVIQLPKSERSALLDRETAGRPELRQRLERLVAAHERRLHGNETKSLSQPDLTHTGSDEPSHSTRRSSEDDHLAGTVIAGKYKLLERIGAGGMGDVWMADQTEPVKRRVAVKLIKAGMDSKQVLARFEAERQALAMMDHPNIAKVLDGGVSDFPSGGCEPPVDNIPRGIYIPRSERQIPRSGNPFFVMELVKGVPITEYCDRHKLTPKQRLELFVPVCQAIQHAHQKGIFHRDIKPSNVLIAMYDDRPVPKVIDFGVAKATGATLTEHTLNTGFGGIVGTPQYMSPEQATLNNLDIDTRSDVYSLGVLLYELLAGSPPFSGEELKKRGLLEMLRVVREDEPPRPSTKLSTADALPSLSANRGTEPKKLTGILRNELDWIVMKSLEKDRSRRYETANGFAADVNRYLSGDPVLAHPPSTGYRLKKFVRRNRPQVIAAGMIFGTLVAGIAGTTVGLLRAESARKRAVASQLGETEERKKADASAKAEVEQRKKAERAEADTLADYRASTDDAIEQLIGSKPELGEKEKSYLENTAKRWQAYATRQGDDERSRAIRGEGHQRVGYLWLKLGRKEEARANYESAIDLLDKLAADFPAVPAYRQNLAKSHSNLGHLLANLGKRSEAEVANRQALKVQEKLTADYPDEPAYRLDRALSHNNLGLLLKTFGKPPEAEGENRKALAIQKKLVADFPAVPAYRRDQARSHNNLGLLLKTFGKPPEAEGENRKALAIQKKLVADFPGVPTYRVELGGSYGNYGTLIRNVGKPAESLEWFDRAIRTLQPVYEKDRAT